MHQEVPDGAHSLYCTKRWRRCKSTFKWRQRNRAVIRQLQEAPLRVFFWGSGGALYAAFMGGLRGFIGKKKFLVGSEHLPGLPLLTVRVCTHCTSLMLLTGQYKHYEIFSKSHCGFGSTCLSYSRCFVCVCLYVRGRDPVCVHVGISSVPPCGYVFGPNVCVCVRACIWLCVCVRTCLHYLSILAVTVVCNWV